MKLKLFGTCQWALVQLLPPSLISSRWRVRFWNQDSLGVCSLPIKKWFSIRLDWADASYVSGFFYFYFLRAPPMNSLLKQMNSNPRVNRNYFFYFLVFSFQQNKRYPNVLLVVTGWNFFLYYCKEKCVITCTDKNFVVCVVMS